MCSRLYLLLFILSGMLWGFASGDLIVLQGGRTIEGTVVESNPDSIVVEMAMGRVTLSRSKVLRIEPTREGDQRRDALKLAVTLEQELGDLKRSLSSLHSLNGKFSVLSVKVQREEAAVHRLEDSLAQLQRRRTEAIEALQPYAQYHGRRVPQRIYEQYVSAQTAHQVASARVSECEQELANARRELSLTRQQLSECRNQMQEQARSIRSRRDELVEKGYPIDEMQDIDKTLERYGDGALFQQIPLRREGNSLFLNVRLNDQLTEEFILDTGCSTMLLTRDVVERLGVRSDAYLGVSTTQIADGSLIEVQNVYLDSVEVNGVRAGRVLAQFALSENGPVPLLLGMSYLERFRFSIDAQRGLLILE